MDDALFDEAGGSVLLSFTAENTRSFRDEAHLTLIASEDPPTDASRHRRVDVSGDEAHVLPVAGVFGANASGKSAIILALRDMEMIVRRSFANVELFREEPRPYFKLDEGGASRPTRLAVEVIVRGSLWHYEFSYDDERITHEYAARTFPGDSQLQVMFERHHDQITYGSDADTLIEPLTKFLRPNALLLSVAGAADQSALAALYKWFYDHVYYFQGGRSVGAVGQTAKLAREGSTYKERILHLLTLADLGLSDIKWTDPAPETVEALRRRMTEALPTHGETPLASPGSEFESVLAAHLGETRFGHRHGGGQVFLAQEAESLGTQAWAGLIGRILLALEDGDLMIVDELDCSLHPLLVGKAIELFQCPSNNPRNAQLLFTAHSPNLMGGSTDDTLGPSQTWLTEKNRDGASSIFSLVDIKPALAADRSNAEEYLRGRFGGLPILMPTDLR